MKLNTRFTLLLAILTLVTLVASLSIFLHVQHAISESDTLNNRHITSIVSAKDLKFHTIQVQQWLTDISATRGLDGLNDGFDLAEEHANRFRTILEELIALLPEHREQLNALHPDFQDYYQTGKLMARAYVDQGPSLGNLKMTSFDEQSIKINEKVDTVVELISSATQLASTRHNNQLVKTSIISITASGFVLLAILLLYVNFSSVLKRLPIAESWLTSMREGVIDIDIKIEKHKAISELASPIEDLRSVLENIIWGIRQTVSQLSSDADQLISTTTTTCNKLSEQQGEIFQVATAANEMSASSQEVANSIASAAEAIALINNETLNSQNIVADAITAIDQLSNHIRATKKDIHNFGEKTKSITSVMDEIKSIAEQTNLLALNAAIEAARAGEQGRGFAVVADEVRTLASRTQDSTEEINRMVYGLNSAALQSVNAMEESCTNAEIAVDKAKQCGLSLTNITESVANMDSMSNQIAASAEEQSYVAEDVSKRITLISATAENTLTNVNELAVTVTGQQELVSNLVAQVGHFQLRHRSS